MKRGARGRQSQTPFCVRLQHRHKEGEGGIGYRACLLALLRIGLVTLHHICSEKRSKNRLVFGKCPERSFMCIYLPTSPLNMGSLLTLLRSRKNSAMLQEFHSKFALTLGVGTQL